MALFLLYVWLKLDTFHTVMTALNLFWPASMFFGVICGVLSANDEEDIYKYFVKWWKRCCVFVVLMQVFNVLLPTQREGAYLIAGYAGLKLAETPEMGKLTEVVRLKVGNYLDDELAAAKSEAAKKIKDAASAAVTK